MRETNQIGTESSRTWQSRRLRSESRCLTASESDIGRQYLDVMRAGIDCALANRQIITHLVREAFAAVLPQATLTLLYDVSHSTCKLGIARLQQRHVHIGLHSRWIERISKLLELVAIATRPCGRWCMRCRVVNISSSLHAHTRAVACRIIGRRFPRSPA